MATTIKDIAQRTGLSLATISKYINGGNVLPENKVAIDQAIHDLDYRVNEFARGLKTNRSKTIGVIIPELDTTFFMRVISEMEYVLRGKNYAVIISDCRTDEKKEAELVDFMLSRQVDGIVNFPMSRTGNHLKPALKRGIPVLLMDRLTTELEGQTDSISIDNVAISNEATRHLLRQGHRHIGMIAGPQGTYTADQRLKGYKNAMKELGVPVNHAAIIRRSYSIQGGFTGLKELMRRFPSMTAVYVTNHEMTLGALMAANEAQCRIPDDLSFLGFDNLDWAKIVVPRLTIVEQPMAKMGEVAAEIMLKRLDEGEDKQPYQAVEIPATLNLGHSVLPR